MNFRQNYSPCPACAGIPQNVGMQTGGMAQPLTATQPLPLPTGAPLGPTYNPPPAPTPTTPSTNFVQGESTQTVLDIQYTQGFLRTQIGRKVKVEFLIGTGMLVDREGTLRYVGTSYIIIQETETDDLLLCDMYSIKFVRFYY